MRLEHAIEVLEKELDFLNTPLEENEEEDIYDGVIGFRKTTDIKVALKILREAVHNSKLID